MKSSKTFRDSRFVSGAGMGRGVLPAVLVLLLAALCAIAQEARDRSGPLHGNDPVKPFRILGNIYYVGMSDVASYLITTPQGHILLDSTYDTSVPYLRDQIEKLGFQIKDVKILLNSHAHSDHLAGHALVKELAGASIWMSAPDAPVLADGGRSDFRSDGSQLWSPVKADHVFRDGEKVSLGGVTLAAHLTPGHTKGCTTWTTVAEDGGKKYNVVFVCGLRLNNGVPLLNNAKYPAIADDYAKSFQTVKALPCDMFLAPHGSFFNLPEKIKRMEQGGANPFIDPGCRSYAEETERAFQAALQKERAGK